MDPVAFALCALWLVWAVIGYVLAAERGRGAAGFLLSLVFGPLGIIMALMLPPGVDDALLADLDALTVDKGKIGVLLDHKDASLIAHVIDDSPAHGAGIQSGDRLIMIDGIPCSRDYRTAVLQVVGDRGTPVKVRVRRNLQVLDHTLTRS